MKQITLALVAVVLAGGGFAGAQEEAADSARRIRDRLASTRINLDFSNARLSEVIAYFQEFSGLNFHLDPSVTSKEDDRVTLRLKDVAMATALKLILKPRDLGCVYRDGVLFIASKAQLGTQTVTRVYDIRDLVYKLADFPGPKFELSPTFSGLDPSSLIQVDDPKTQFTEENLIDLIKANTGDRSWEDTSVTSISQVNGLLVIAQSRPIQEEVRRLLDLLRQYK